jgi:hypothetical protein
MTHRFTARAVAAEVDPANDVLQAGVAEDHDGEGFFLLFMSNIGEPSRQNVLSAPRRSRGRRHLGREFLGVTVG